MQYFDNVYMSYNIKTDSFNHGLPALERFRGVFRMKLFVKIVTKVNLKQLTILSKRSILDV